MSAVVPGLPVGASFPRANHIDGWSVPNILKTMEYYGTYGSWYVVDFNWQKLDGAAVRPGRPGLSTTLSVKNLTLPKSSRCGPCVPWLINQVRRCGSLSAPSLGTGIVKEARRAVSLRFTAQKRGFAVFCILNFSISYSAQKWWSLPEHGSGITFHTTTSWGGRQALNRIGRSGQAQSRRRRLRSTSSWSL